MRELTRQGRRRDWLAAQLGIGKWTLSRVEAGVQSAPEGFYERAAEILGVSVDVVSPEQAIAA